jgi:hypothetical protein
MAGKAQNALSAGNGTISLGLGESAQLQISVSTADPSAVYVATSPARSR